MDGEEEFKGEGKRRFSFVDARGERHEGEWADEEKDGSGVLMCSDALKYEGERKGGQFHGRGVQTFPNGERYVGEWKVGKKNGCGVYAFSDCRYEGEWKDGKYHGHGVFMFSSGARYEGGYKDGVRNGHGVFTFRDGERYEGEYKDMSRNGLGVFTFSDGRRYEGEHKDDEYHGHGVSTFPDGRRYEGGYKDGEYHGHGVFTFPDGRKYEQEWKEGKRSHQKRVPKPCKLRVPVLVKDIKDKTLPLVRGSQRRAVENANKARNVASDVERMLSLLSLRDKEKGEEKEMKEKKMRIVEMPMKNAISQSHKEFIEEQRKRYEGVMDEITDIVTCPITMVVMEEPVVADDGHTYERSAIAEWVKKKGTSPLTRERMSSHFVPNMSIRKMIERLKSSGHKMDD
jgi:hypothetical protein